jgi:4-diphosphocytidyl-2-C-methyl-D-erythritol kinase
VTRALTARAPAKINLGLRIVGRRSDGLHELESLFVPLDLCDELRLQLVPGGDGSVGLRDAGGPFPAPPDANLAVRAAEAFLAETGLEASLEIELAKHVPIAAGLGGGSSDAGAVLRTLAADRPGAISPGRLREIALSLGADVPFFLDPRPAQVGGIGERIEPCPLPGELCLLLLNPGRPLSTASVYGAFDRLEPGPRPPARPSLVEAFARPEALAALLHNDLEAPAGALLPVLPELRERLRSLGARAVGMSGSGPTLFGVFGSRAEARDAAARGGFEAPLWARVAGTGEAG